MRIYSAPVASLHDAHALLRLLEEERIADERTPRLYYDALQIVIGNGDQVRATIFAERACSARAVLEGEDSPEMVRLTGLAERPTAHRIYGTSMRWKQALKEFPQGSSEQEFDDWLWMKEGQYHSQVLERSL